MTNVFDYIFNVGGNFTAQMNGMSAAAVNFSVQANVAESKGRSLLNTFAMFSYVNDAVQNVSNSIRQFGEAALKLDKQMHELSAVAGVTGDTLKQIEGFARESAKAFGTDAAVAVEGYKLLLSQLSPELAKYPDVLRSMGDCIQTTSKLMGGDGVAAAQVLTTAMNQYGVSLDDPVTASQEMARMMNVMAAAGQAGSAELPAISAALQQCGMAAKAAGVNFEETNAAIQVLDKAGKKASEGGVALRNVLGQLSKGRFVDKQARDELEKAGIDVVALGNNSLSLKERLDMLKPMLNDSALLAKFFGVENANAAMALIQGTDALQDFTDAVTGTNSATEQAEIIMQSYEEKQAVFKQQIDDLKITISEFFGDFGIAVGAVSSLFVPIAQLYPLLQGVWTTMLFIKRLNWARMWSDIVIWVRQAAVNFAIMNRTLSGGSMLSLGFARNVGRAAIALVRLGTVGVFNALKGLGALILSFITGGATSAAFSATASAAFATFATTASTACRAVGVALMNIPIVGWIAAAVVGLVAIGVYFWNTSAKFRAVLKGIWAAFKTVFSSIGDIAKHTFSAIGDLIVACFNLNPKGITAALGKLNTSYTDFGKQVGKAFKDAYDAEMADAKKEEEKEKETEKVGNNGKPKPKGKPKEDPNNPQTEVKPEIPKADPTAGTLSEADGRSSAADNGVGKIRNITITIDKLVDTINLNTTTITEGTERMKEAVMEALMGALNDTQLTTG